MNAPDPRPQLVALELADPPNRWADLGFAVRDQDRIRLGGVELRLGAPGRGITAWSLTHVEQADIDGLHTKSSPRAAHPAPHETHPNGAIGIDHVVILTPDFARTAAALDRAGMPLRRTREEGGVRQGFRRLGPAILELVDAGDSGQPRDAPARFWGLVVIVEDLTALAERLGDHLGRVRSAVQPGRQIATLRDSAGLGAKVAFMDPDPQHPEPDNPEPPK